LHDPAADIVGDAVPDAAWPRTAILQRLRPAGLVEIVPANGMDGSPSHRSG
jgi:hypothetical protein